MKIILRTVFFALLGLGAAGQPEQTAPPKEEVFLTELEVSQQLSFAAPFPAQLELDQEPLLFLSGNRSPDYRLLSKLFELPEPAEELQEERSIAKVLRPSEEDPNNTSPHPYLHDPESLLTQRQRGEIGEFLSLYAEQSDDPLHLILLRKDDLEAHLSQRVEGQHRAVTLYYPYEAPEKVEVFFSSHSTRELPRRLEEQFRSAALSEARREENSYDALYRFLLDFTIALDGYLKSSLATRAGGDEKVAESFAEQGGGQSRRSTQKTFFKSFPQHSAPFIALKGGAGLLALTAALMWWKGRRQRRDWTGCFSSRRAAPILGLNHAFGGSGVLQFGPSSKEPKQQEKKVLPPQ